jgi:hypothetical protein
MNDADFYEIRMNYEDGEPFKFKSKDIDKGVTAIYGYNSLWKEWRIVALRFNRLIFPRVESVEYYMNKRYKEKVINMLSGKVFNEKLRTEVEMLLMMAGVRLKDKLNMREGTIYG